MNGFQLDMRPEKAIQVHNPVSPVSDRHTSLLCTMKTPLNRYKKMRDERTHAANKAPLTATGILDGYSIFSRLPDEI